MQAVYANGAVSSFFYNAARGFLAGVRHVAGSGAWLSNSAYGFDARGRIVFVADSVDAAQGWSYSYDGLDRLVSAANAGNPVLSQSWTYAPDGNIASSSALGAFAYGAAHPHAAVSAGGQALYYDANGNMGSGLGRNFYRDGDNRIVAATTALGGV